MEIKTNKGSFYHPVLQMDRFDYKNNQLLKTMFFELKDCSNKIKIPYKIDLNARLLTDLINTGDAELIFHIEHKNNRKIIKGCSMEGELLLNKNDYSPNYSISILPLIISVKNLEFKDVYSEFDEFYDLIDHWDVEKGAILGVGEGKRISVNQEPSTFSNLIVVRKGEKKDKEILVSLGDRISVILPPKVHSSFLQSKTKSKMINLYVLTVALNYAIYKLLSTDIDDDMDLWAKKTINLLTQKGISQDALKDVDDIVVEANALTMLLLEDYLEESFDQQVELVRRMI